MLDADRPDHRGQLAAHLWAARAVVGRAAVPAQVAAADDAERVYAHDQAADLLRRALIVAREYSPDDAATELTLLLRLFGIIAATRGWGDEELSALVDRAQQLTQATTLTDSAVRPWWYLFLFLLETHDAASYVEVVRTLEGSLDAPAGAVAAAEPLDPASRAALHLMAFSAGSRRAPGTRPERN